MLQQLNPAFRATLLLTVLTGLVYPGLVTGLCQLLFKEKSNGSIILQHDQIVGSRLIGQNFTAAKYFHPRPSAAGNDGYDATSSSGSNLGPTNQKLYERVKAAAAQFRQENPDYQGAIPADALTTSGSGLDPDISVANAQAQAARVSAARGADRAAVDKLIASETRGRDLGFLGEARVNVLELNLALDRTEPIPH
ncbi:MAG TPA: potassium-transporting ATPase subunit KdpC [Bryobacteraceae bacterium]|nr:potassium-transporting ATPase subunit KdpC [Bryobacteraceae bacterium]